MSGISPAPFGRRIATLDNNISLNGKETGGVERAMVVIAGDNLTYIGDGANQLLMRGNGRSVLVTEIQKLPFVSAEQTIILSSMITIAHGLGAIPRGLGVFLRCKTAELNYAVNDEIRVSDDSGNTRSIQLSADATNLYISIHANAPQITNKLGGSQAAITLANFRIIVRAWP